MTTITTKDHFDATVTVPLVVIIAFCLIFLAGWAGWSALEARAFNSVTGKSVSTFDAMFISLRVQEPSK